MDGPDILAQTLTVPALTRTKNPQLWQYHSRGTRHSITPCWGVLLDLLGESAVLRGTMSSRGRSSSASTTRCTTTPPTGPKNLDLVIARPTSDGGRTGRTFRDLPLSQHGAPRSASEAARVPAGSRGRTGRCCPPGARGEGDVHRATQVVPTVLRRAELLTPRNPRFVEQRARCRARDHQRRRPLRLADQEPDFPRTGEAEFSEHNQPKDALGAIKKVRQLPGRTSDDGVGYEGLGIILVDCANDGSPVTVATAPEVPDNYSYDRMVTRLANEYDVRFRNI